MPIIIMAYTCHLDSNTHTCTVVANCNMCYYLYDINDIHDIVGERHIRVTVYMIAKDG